MKYCLVLLPFKHPGYLFRSVIHGSCITVGGQHFPSYIVSLPLRGCRNTILNLTVPELINCRLVSLLAFVKLFFCQCKIFYYLWIEILPSWAYTISMPVCILVSNGTAQPVQSQRIKLNASAKHYNLDKFK